MKVAPGRIAFIARFSFPDCVRWASSTNTNSSPFARKSEGRASSISRRNAAVVSEPVSPPPAPNLWTRLQTSHGVVRLRVADKVGPALGPVHVLPNPLEHPLDLLVELGPVGDDEDAAAVDVLADPLGEPHHGQALARALGVPDDAALAGADVPLGRLDAEVLVVAGELLDARVEDDEVVDEFEEPALLEEPDEGAVEGVASGAYGGVAGGGREVLLLRRVAGAVAGGPPRATRGSTSPASRSRRSGGPPCRSRP